MKRLTLFFGHYGSGKTNIAINYALHLKEKFDKVAIADIDIVNPYFRTKDSEDILTQNGIRVVALPFANTNVDLPALPPEVYGLVQSDEYYTVLDIGGDDRGAFALGRYTPYILEENNYEALYVTNFYRPLTQTPEDALEVIREIEEACKIKMTGIVNNSNIGELTTADDIIATMPKADELSQIAGIPVVFTCAEKNIADNSNLAFFPLTLQKKPF